MRNVWNGCGRYLNGKKKKVILEDYEENLEQIILSSFQQNPTLNSEKGNGHNIELFKGSGVKVFLLCLFNAGYSSSDPLRNPACCD